MPKDIRISKKQVIAPAITAAVVLMMAPAILSTAYAQNPHFIRDPSCEVQDDGSLECSGRVAGLGNELQQVEAHLVADISATWGCDNPGRGGDGIHIPPGQPTEDQDAAGDTQLLDVRNGNVRFTLTIDTPTAPDLDCPGANWDVVLVEITYDNVELVIEGFSPLEIGGPFSATLIRV